MKKIILLTFIVLLLSTLSGCWYNASSGSNYGKLIDIKFYDLEYHEIEGEFIHYYNWKYTNPTNQFRTISKQYIPINSPAPIELYYTSIVEMNSTLIVRIIIEQKNGYQFESLKLNMFDERKRDDFYNVEEDGTKIYLDILCEHISEETNEFEISSFYLTKEMTNGVVTKQGSSHVEGRTYYSGFLFQFNQPNNL